LFEQAGLIVHAYTAQTVLDPTAVWTSDGRFYTVFTPFKRAWIMQFKEEGGVRTVSRPRRRPEAACRSDTVPSPIDGFDVSKGRPDLWLAGEGPACTPLDNKEPGSVPAGSVAGNWCGPPVPASLLS
jgi:deoxyribodipyrimidine photo-lyase